MIMYTRNLKEAGQREQPSTREICRGLKDQMVYDATGLKCLGEMRQLEMEELIRDMVETAEEFVSDNIADEASGSHGDLHP